MQVQRTYARENVFPAIVAYVATFAGFSPNMRRLLLANLCMNIGLGVFGVLFNLYLIALGQPLSFLGLVAAVSPIGQACIAPILAWALPRYGARDVMVAGAAVMALALALTAFLSNGLLLILLSFLSGAAFSAVATPASPYMMEYARPHQRSYLFSAYFASSTVGSMIGSLLSGIAPALIGALAGQRGQGLRLPERGGLLVGVLAVAGGIVILRGLRSNEAPPASVEMAIVPAHEESDEQHTRRDMIAMLAGLALIALTMGATLPFFNVYFHAVLHASTGTIGIIYALSGLVCTAAAFLAPALGRWGRLQGFSIARALTAPLVIVLVFHPGVALAATAYIARNAFGTVAGALENTFGMEVIPAHLRGHVASWRSGAFNAAWSIGSLLAGLAATRIGYDGIFILSGVLTLLGIAAYYTRFGRVSR